MIIEDFLKELYRTLEGAGVANPRLDAEVLLARVLGMEPYRLIVEHRRVLSAPELRRARSFVKRRSSGEPVAYITGVKEFYSLEFAVSPEVLIPRPETELLVDLVIYYARPGDQVLDVGTGSGAIAVSIKRNRPDVEVYASDISPGALRIARKNSRRLLKGNAVRFMEGDMLAPFGGRRFNIIVSNPPYIDPGERTALQKEIHFEPASALYAGDRGREAITRLVNDAAGHLFPQGILLLEIAPAQREYVLETGKNRGFSASVLNDYAGLPRVALLKREK